jgi:hypothetical protein
LLSTKAIVPNIGVLHPNLVMIDGSTSPNGQGRLQTIYKRNTDQSDFDAHAGNVSLRAAVGPYVSAGICERFQRS